MFASQSHKDDLITMLMAVDKKIQEKDAEKCQTTETVNRGFNKRLYFNTGIRKGPCVDEDCNDAVPLNELNYHVIEKHNGERGTVDSNGQITENFYIDWTGLENLDGTWQFRYYKYSGHTFFPRLVKRNGFYYVYMKILSHEDAARGLQVDLEVVNPRSNATIKLTGMKVYPVDMKWQKVIEEGEGVLTFDQKMAGKLFGPYYMLPVSQ